MSLIFVSTGTVSFPFKRLVDAVIEFYKKKPAVKVVIQSGAYQVISFQKHIKTQQYFSIEKMVKFYKTADIIISAAGEASVFLVLEYARNQPIIVPRLKKYGEHVDDQQLLIARYLKRKKLAYVILSTNELKTALKNYQPKPAAKHKARIKTSLELRRLVKNLDRITIKYQD